MSGEVAGDYSLLGMEHIWGGMDHLLFVFGLLLLVGGGARLLWTITAFTIGHSITLSLVTLGFFDYPVALVEFAIALSIFVLAVELTRISRHDMLWRNPWWLAGGFGLLHGMGFAGALAETGLPQDNVPLALLFFNVGHRGRADRFHPGGARYLVPGAQTPGPLAGPPDAGAGLRPGRPVRHVVYRAGPRSPGLISDNVIREGKFNERQ